MKKHFTPPLTLLRFCLFPIVIFSLLSPSFASDEALVISSTTSTENSGFFAYILPIFTRETGVKTKVLAQGTGQAIQTARHGDADLLFVHHKKSEEKFVKDGYGVKRFDVMYNDFIVVGPKSDPDKIKGVKNLKDAFLRLAQGKVEFISRGDESGTHKKEKQLWRYANIRPRGAWYVESGSSMGATLNMASSKNAYTLSDRGTWLAFKNKGSLGIVYEKDPRLFNPYGLIAVNPKKFPHTKIRKANIFIKWFTSARGQQYIAKFQIRGQQAFFPNAKR